MNLQEEFNANLKKQFPDIFGKKLLIACSGGLDSVVLAHLTAGLEAHVALAHCNFSLRGKESDTDEIFVIGLAKQLEVPVFVETFDTVKYARQNKLSIQLAARELRYTWFDRILIDFKYDYLLTAHHLDDDFETFLINLSRGTGIRGLTGIPVKNNKIIRPLLDFSRGEIHQWALSRNIQWREDSSNSDPDYLRNKIRLNVLPSFKETNPAIYKNFKTTRRNLKSVENLLDDYMALVFRLAVVEDKDGYHIHIEKLKDLPNTDALLYELLNGFGFTEWDDVTRLLDAQTGKQVFSKTHRLIRNRDVLLLTEIRDNFNHIEIDVPREGIKLPAFISIEEVKHIQSSDRNSIYVDADKINFPLILRKRKEGDVFFPFGMNGKKKVSKYFKDEKFSIPEKENTWLLCSGEKIVWIVNHRADNRFRVTDKTERILKITFEKSSIM